MNPRRILAACGAALVACGGPDDPDQAHQASAACPLKTPADWQAFLQRAVAEPAWLTTCSDQSNCEELVGAFRARVKDEIQARFEQCSEDLATNPPIAACTANLRAYVPTWLAQHSSDAYGFVQSNRDYFAAQTALDAPSGMMDPPAALLQALPERTRLEVVAQASGWPFLTHVSALGGLRLIFNVTDPEHRFEQWLLVGVSPEQGAIASGTILSFLALQLQSADGSLLPKPRIHFRDYVLKDAEGQWGVELPEHYEGKCYACHGSGVRQLVPFAGELTSSRPVAGEPEESTQRSPAEVGRQRLESMNRRLASYGLADFHNSIDQSALGPSLGAGLGCTQCHDGKTRGPITTFTSEGMLYLKVLDQLSMRSFDGKSAVPDQAAMELRERERGGAELSESERAALEAARRQHEADYRILVESRQADFEAWVLAVACR